MNGFQCSDLDRPTYLDCNKFIVDSVSLEMLSEDSKTVSGWQVYCSHDQQLLSILLLEYGFKVENKIKRFPKVKNRILRKCLKNNPSYKSYKKDSLWMNCFVKWITGEVLFGASILTIVLLDYLLFRWLDWYLIIEWVLGIALAIGGFVALYLFAYDDFVDMHKRWITELYNKSKNKQLQLSGYVEIYRPDLKKKSLFWEGVKGAFLGIFG